MTRFLVPLLALGVTACTGCIYTAGVTRGWDLYTNSARNLSCAPARFVDEVALTVKIRSLAESTWHAVSKADASGKYSVHYACGFKAGFADYLDSGGGSTPAVPPYRYRRHGFHGATGQLAAEEWHAGFLHGVGIAKGSGIREAMLTPVFDRPSSGRTPGPDFAGPLAETDLSAPHMPPPAPVLPAPRPVPNPG
jgi:hypothetical protein